MKSLKFRRDMATTALSHEKNPMLVSMKRTMVLGISVFALSAGAFAQTTEEARDFEAYKESWKQTHNVKEMSDAQYEQMKTDWSQSRVESKEPVRELPEAVRLRETRNAFAPAGAPADFPVKTQTGNPTVDEETYQMEKAAWIEKNQDAYNQLNKQAAPTKAELEERERVLNNK